MMAIPAPMDSTMYFLSGTLAWRKTMPALLLTSSNCGIERPEQVTFLAPLGTTEGVCPSCADAHKQHTKKDATRRLGRLTRHSVYLVITCAIVEFELRDPPDVPDPGTSSRLSDPPSWHRARSPRPGFPRGLGAK